MAGKYNVRDVFTDRVRGLTEKEDGTVNEKLQPQTTCSPFTKSVLVLTFVLLLVSIYITNSSSKRNSATNRRHNLKFNNQLSEIFTRLWELDVNKCKPDVDYKLDLQGYVTTTKMTGKDWASRHLFTWVKEDKVFAKPTYKAFLALLDNYESDTTKPEEVTPQEEQENWHFLDLVMETSVMKEAHQFLINNNKASADVSGFKRTLYNLWFKMYKRLFGDHAVNSCGFEHVFVGETRGHEVTGFHNWIQFYLQEKKGRVDYRGYFRRGTTEEFEKSPRIMTLQFIWNRSSAKPIGSSFIGTSPELEMALYTIMFLMNEEDVLVKIKVYDVELVCHKHGQGIGTAFPMSKSD